VKTGTIRIVWALVGTANVLWGRAAEAQPVAPRRARPQRVVEAVEIPFDAARAPQVAVLETDTHPEGVFRARDFWRMAAAGLDGSWEDAPDEFGQNGPVMELTPKAAAEMEIRGQYQRLLDVELFFLGRVAHAAPPVRKRIRDVGRGKFESFVARAAQSRTASEMPANGFGQVILALVGGGRPPRATAAFDENAEFNKFLEGIAGECFDEATRKEYQSELERRRAGQRRAAVELLVAELDGRYMLSAEQRARIAESLDGAFQTAWSQALDAYLAHGDFFFPELPDDLIAPHLSESQRKTWNERQRGQTIMWGNQVLLRLPGDETQSWGDEPSDPGPRRDGDPPNIDRGGAYRGGPQGAVP